MASSEASAAAPRQAHAAADADAFDEADARCVARCFRFRFNPSGFEGIARRIRFLHLTNSFADFVSGSTGRAPAIIYLNNEKNKTIFDQCLPDHYNEAKKRFNIKSLFYSANQKVLNKD